MVADSNLQFTDPEVTRSKFEREVIAFQAARDSYLRRGVVCRCIAYPTVSLMFAAPHLKPAAIAFAVDIDFTNYDFEPPSVKFIDPFTGVRLKGKDPLPKVLQVVQNAALPPNMIQVIPLVQGMPDDDAFLCLPGIREYHLHPAHSGDSWFLYRSRGEGTLAFIIDQLHKHSVGAVVGYDCQISITVNGLNMQPDRLPR